MTKFMISIITKFMISIIIKFMMIFSHKFIIIMIININKKLFGLVWFWFLINRFGLVLNFP